MTVKELAGVFDGSTILYIQNEYEKILDKKCAFFVEKMYLELAKKIKISI